MVLNRMAGKTNIDKFYIIDSSDLKIDVKNLFKKLIVKTNRKNKKHILKSFKL